jgi:subtilisin family serine protease
MARSIISIVPGNNYAIWEGTSFSTAFTSGCAALVRAQHPQWPNASTPSSSIRTRVKTTLEQTGSPIDPTDPFFDGMLGVSRISAVGAVSVGPFAPAASDVNFDGLVNAADLAVMLGNWGPTPTFVRSDLNADGEVNAQDIAILLSNW